MEFNLSELTGESVYKLMLSCIVPRPIAWISTISKEGIYNIAPFSFYTGITSKLPLILVSIGRKESSVKKDTWKNIDEVGDFVINIVTHDLVEKMNITATAFEEEVDEFVQADLTPIPSHTVKSPRIKESLINIECRKHMIIEIADMGVVIGEILKFHIEDSLLNEKGYVDNRKLKVVGRMGGADYCLVSPESIFTLKRLDKR
ncbi:MAG: flavin reductase family protein [Hydrogenothermaceae bacterium]|nr:flavin reductase family protein [Hydrogenothermaceae bacterium]